MVRGNVSIVLPRWQAQRVGGEYFSSLLGGFDEGRRTWGISYLSRKLQLQIESGAIRVVEFDKLRNVVALNTLRSASDRSKPSGIEVHTMPGPTALTYSNRSLAKDENSRFPNRSMPLAMQLQPLCGIVPTP